MLNFSHVTRLWVAPEPPSAISGLGAPTFREVLLCPRRVPFYHPPFVSA